VGFPPSSHRLRPPPIPREGHHPLTLRRTRSGRFTISNGWLYACKGSKDGTLRQWRRFPHRHRLPHRQDLHVRLRRRSQPIPPYSRASNGSACTASPRTSQSMPFHRLLLLDLALYAGADSPLTSCRLLPHHRDGSLTAVIGHPDHLLGSRLDF